MIDPNNPSLWDIPLAILIVSVVVGMSYLFLGGGGSVKHDPQPQGDKQLQVPMNVDVMPALCKGWLAEVDNQYGMLTVVITASGIEALELDAKMVPSLRKFMEALRG